MDLLLEPAPLLEMAPLVELALLQGLYPQISFIYYSFLWFISSFKSLLKYLSEMCYDVQRLAKVDAPGFVNDAGKLGQR